MSVPDYKINYKSDFVLTINGDAGWATQFCIKFWTGMPSQAYFVGFDGVKYVNCRVGDTPTQLLVMFDDHHLPIGPLRMQIAYHTTIEEFPGSVFDEVTNARDVIVTIDGTDYQVLLDFTGEDSPELEFDLPAYANEAERIQNELQRQQNEADRIAAELQREQATAAAVQGAENVNAQLNGTTLTVTNRQGVSTSVNTKGEQGEQGPVGPEGPQGEMGISIVSFLPKSETSTTLIYTVTFSDGHTQDVAIPKGPKGDTGATGPTGPQGQTGVSITGLVKTGETETDTLYNITFSNGTTQQVAIPKGEKGDTGDQGPVGPQGPQGPMGDVSVITPEQQAVFTMYSVTGQNTDGPMTQKAVTDALVAGSISYDNSQSGLAADDVQGAVDEIDSRFEREEAIILLRPTVLKKQGWSNSFEIPLIVGKKYKLKVSADNTDSGIIGIFLYSSTDQQNRETLQIGRILSGSDSTEFIYKHSASADYRYIGFWNNRNVNTVVSCEVIEYETININDINSEVLSIYDKVFFEKGKLNKGVEQDADNALRTPFIPVTEDITLYITFTKSMPSGTYTYLVFYKDNIFVRSVDYGVSSVIEVSASDEYNQVRVLMYRSSDITVEQAESSFATINPSQVLSNIDSLNTRVEKLENNGNIATVDIYANDIAIDLSTEVLNLANESCTNQKFTGTSIASSNNWRLLNDVIPAVAGEYYVVDNSGGTKYFQLAYVNSNGDILKVHGSDAGKNGNYISNYYIRTLNATGIRIAVNTTSLSGLHLVNGRKFKIVDEAKRNAFNNLCSDGRINVAYMKDASDVNRIVMALKLAGSYGVVYIPSGRYELSSCIYAGLSGQSIEMESDTMLVASDGFTDDYLMVWSFAAVDASDPEFPNPQGESSALTNAHITGGVFDAKGLCGCLRLYNFRGIKVNNCLFYNAATNGVLVEEPGFELIMHGCAARNDIPGLSNNIGFNLRCNDCHYYDLIAVNYHTGFKVTGNAFLTRCHPWIGRIDFPTYYAGSIGFDLGQSYGCQITDCYSDTFQTHYKLGQLTKLIGCTTLSSRKDAFPIDEYGDVNLIHNDYNNNVIIGCTFRTSGVTPVRNSGSKDVTEIGCTYTTT